MDKDNVLNIIKTKYKKYLIPDDVLENLYEKALLQKDISLIEAIHNEVSLYLKDHLDFKTVLQYLSFLNINSNINLDRLKNRLITFCDYLEDVNYELTEEEIETLLKEEAFKYFFTKIFKGKTVTNNYLINTLNNNPYLIDIALVYLKQNNIELINDSTNDFSYESPSKNLTKEEEYNLFIRFKNGDKEALNILMEANENLVKWVIMNHFKFYQTYSYEDIVQEGLIGLYNAILKFDVTKGCKFSTHAVWWIRQNIQNALRRNDRFIHLPPKLKRKSDQILISKNILEKEANHTASNKEIAKFLNLDEREVQNIMTLYEHPASINYKFSDEQQEMEIKLPSNENIEEDFIKNNNIYWIIPKLKKILSANEYEVLNLWLGLENNTQLTFEQISERKHITKQRAHQIKEQALNKIRNNSYVFEISNYSREYTKQIIMAAKEKNNYNAYTVYDSNNFPLNYCNLSLQEIIYIVKTLSSSYQEAIYTKYGQNLLENNEIPEENLNYINTKITLVKTYIRNLATNDLKIILKENNLEKIKKLVEALPVMWQKLIYQKHGQNLDEIKTCSEANFTKEEIKNYYFVIYELAKHNIHKINDKKLEYYKRQLMELKDNNLKGKLLKKYHLKYPDIPEDLLLKIISFSLLHLKNSGLEYIDFYIDSYINEFLQEQKLAIIKVN